MRRMPYVAILNGDIKYICPSCMRVIPRDIYTLQDVCPYCNSFINRYAFRIMKWYKEQDKSFYHYFIRNTRRK